jgi:hypothetical protein
MDDLAKDIAEKLGFKSRGDLHYGSIDDCWFTLSGDAQGRQITMLLSTKKNIPMEDLKRRLEDIEAIKSVIFDSNFITINLSSENRDADALFSTINDIRGALRENYAYSCCGLCHEKEVESFYAIDGQALPLCASCYQEKVQLLEGNQPIPPASYLMGFLGALLGGIVGSSVWIVIGLVGFVASIGGVAISYASYFGYRKFGGKNGIFAFICVVVSVILSVVFAELFGLGIEVVKYANGSHIQLSLAQIVSVVFNVVTSGEDNSQIFLNMGLGFLFAGLGSFRLLKTLFAKSAKVNFTLERI